MKIMKKKPHPICASALVGAIRLQTQATLRTLHWPRPSLAVSLVTLLTAFGSSSTQAVSIVNISIPVGSMDSGHSVNSGVYSEAPGPAAVGIGRIVDPAYDSGFSLHDHGYISAHVPDPAQSVVTYQFDSLAVITALELNVHANGISKIEAFVGDTLGSLTSIGVFTGSLGAPLGSAMFTEHALNTFSFGNTTAGLYFQFIVTETTLADGYANYHAILNFHEPDTNTVPDTLGWSPFAATILGLVALRHKLAPRPARS